MASDDGSPGDTFDPTPPTPADSALVSDLAALQAQLRDAEDHIDRLRIALADNTWAMASRRRKLAAKVRHTGVRLRNRLRG